MIDRLSIRCFVLLFFASCYPAEDNINTSTPVTNTAVFQKLANETSIPGTSTPDTFSAASTFLDNVTSNTEVPISTPRITQEDNRTSTNTPISIAITNSLAPTGNTVTITAVTTKPIPQPLLIWIVNMRIFFPYSTILSSPVKDVLNLPSFRPNILLNGVPFSEYWALASNYKLNLIYFTDYRHNFIGAYDTQKNNYKPVFKDMSYGIDGIAVDWITNNLYWVDTDKNWIMVSDQSFTNFFAISAITSKVPAKIAIDPFERSLYWSEVGSSSCNITKSDLTGNNKVLIHSFSDVISIDDLIFDPVEKRLYWTERITTDGSFTMAKIKTCPISSPNNITQIFAQEKSLFFGIASYKDTLYVSDKLSKQFVLINKHTRAVSRISFGLLPSPRSILVYSPEIQPATIADFNSNPCTNHTCGQLCIALQKTSYKCYCGLGYYLAANGKSCLRQNIHNNFFLVFDSAHNKIFQVPFESPEKYAIIPVTNVGVLQSVNYDDSSRMVYFSDTEKKTISRCFLNGSNQDVFLTGIKAYSISIDTISRNLYFADSVTDSIAVASLELKNISKTLQLHNIFKTFEMHVDTKLRKIFWSDWGGMSGDGSSVGRVECANLDGTSRKVLVEGAYQPHGITIDSTNKIVYWTEFYEGKIGWLNMQDKTSGSYNVGFKKHVPLNGNRLIGISLFDSTLFVTDLVEKSIHSVTTSDVMNNVDHKTAVKPYGPNVFFSLTGIKFFTKQSYTTNGCSLQRGGCQQICLPISTGRNCTCADHYSLSADNSCQKSYNQDTDPPSFGTTCPQSRTVYLERCAKMYNLTFPYPVATDGSGRKPKVRSSIHQSPPYLIVVGEYLYEYIAEDLSGNKAYCQFTVNVRQITCSESEIPDGKEVTCGSKYGSNFTSSCMHDTALQYPVVCTFQGQWESRHDQICPLRVGTVTSKPRTTVIHALTNPGPSSHRPGNAGLIAFLVLFFIGIAALAIFVIFKYRHKVFSGGQVFWRRGDDLLFLTQDTEQMAERNAYL